jgi:catechol 2,3-dioxygenase-like lactoylglutathione lyase family enzyme
MSSAASPPQSWLRVELFVSDLERSVQFYSEVLGFERISRSLLGDYTVMRRGLAQIALQSQRHLDEEHPLKPRAAERLGVCVELVVEVDDLAAAHACASRRWPLETELGLRPWGRRDFRLLDPDGFYVRVTSLDLPSSSAV